MTIAAMLIDAVAEWAKARADILAVAVVGSYARGDARPDSDIDFVLVCSDPARYLRDTSWVSAFGEVGELSLEDWGLVQSVRVFYSGGREVEFGLTGPAWTQLPPDRGTAEVVRAGCSILFDRVGELTRVQEFVTAGT